MPFFTGTAELMGVPNVSGKQLKNEKDSAVSDHLLLSHSFWNFQLL